jgi:stearoyl-CoA desaturase (delta-9 desaturase)
MERGFFFAHVGWLLCKKSKKLTEEGDKLDLSDLLNDKIVQF